MAHDPKTYRDPKVTTETRHTSSSGAMRWVWIVLGAIVVLLLLAWLLGWYETDSLATMPADGATAVEGTTNEAVQDIQEGAAATGNAVEGAVEDAGDNVEVETAPAPPAD